MRIFSTLLVLCMSAFTLLGCGGGGGSSRSGKAQFTLNGTPHVFKAVEFRIDVNPVMGQPDLKRTIESGNVQPIRYVLQSKGYPKLKDGKGFLIAWWIDGDDPMGLLKGLVDQDLSCIYGEAITLHYMLEIEGSKDITCNERWENRFTLDKVEEDVISGTFEGEFATKGPDGYVPVKIEAGSFEAPITKMFKQE